MTTAAVSVKRLELAGISDEILQVIFSFIPAKVCSSCCVCRRFALILPGSKCVLLMIPRLSWGADGSWGRRCRHQEQRVRRFCGKSDQLVHLRLHDTIAMVPLLREFSDILPRVTLLDLNACLLPIEAAECSNFQQLTTSMSARNSSVEAELAAGDGVQVRCEDTEWKHSGCDDTYLVVLTLRVLQRFYVYTGGAFAYNATLSLMRGCSGALTTLCLSNNALSAKDMPALCDALLPLLLHGSGGQTGRAVGCVGAVVVGGSGGALTLTNLDLSYNGFGGGGAEELSRVFGVVCGQVKETF